MLAPSMYMSCFRRIEKVRVKTREMVRNTEIFGDAKTFGDVPDFAHFIQKVKR